MPSSSSMAETAWMRTRLGVMQWTRQSSEFESEIEGVDTVLVIGRTAVAKREDPDLCIGGPMAFHLEITPSPPSEARRIPPSWAVTIFARETRRNHVQFTLVKDVDWNIIGYTEGKSHEPKMISKEFTQVPK